MAEGHEDLVKHFCDVTGADESRSRFFLESADWQLDLAISSFFESDANTGNQPDKNAAQRQDDPIPVYSDSDPELMEEATTKPPAVSKNKGKGKRPTANPRFGTLEQLKKQQSSSDEEEGQAFYAGGSERSGQQILGPNKGARNDIVADMFRSAREQGAVLADEPPEQAGPGRFQGTGYRLGATPDDHSVISAANREDGQARTVSLRLWRDGFSVDDGDLRPYTHPESAAFLNSVRQGEIPAELRGGGSEVRISLEDRRHIEFPGANRKSRQQAFSGKGHLLGSPAPATVGTTALVDLKDKTANQKAAQAALELDESQPVTSIQFRLADGSRLVGRFNHSHTVASLRQYILSAVPAYQLQNFTLMTTFPNAELADPELTIDQAKLQNAVVVQKIT